MKGSRARGRPTADALEADIIDLAHDGRGLARINGKVTLIADSLPGERIRFRTLRGGRDVDEGQALEVLSPSAERVTPACPHYGLCGGCALQHLDPAAQLRFKQKQLLDGLQRIGRVVPESVAEPLVGPAWGYRRRARLGVKWLPKRGLPAVGFRERNSPLLTALQVCPVLEPRIEALLQPLTGMIATLAIRDHLPQIEVAAAERVALVLRVLQTPGDADRQTLAAFAAQHRLDLYLQPGGPDSVSPLGEPPSPLSYSPDGGADRLQFTATDFIQVNDAVSRASVRQALGWLALQPGETVLELFCGLGNFSVPMARQGAQVTGVEGEETLVQRARDNAARLRLDIRYARADLFKPDPHTTWAQPRYDAALLDPPRAGAAEVLPLLAARKPSRIVYVSCHPGTLARDAGVLVNQYGYRLKRVGVMDMFPHTAHVESMALFEAGQPRSR